MSRHVKIFPYKLGSVSARDLARGLNIKRIIPGGSWRANRRSVLINWGSTQCKPAPTVLNRPEAVRIASNKLLALRAMKQAGVTVPDFSPNVQDARDWQERGFRVFARHLLSSHSGRGIQIVHPGEQLPFAPLYVKYIKKENEYRVHVFKETIIDLTQKRRKVGVERDTGLIRNIANGWIFARTNVAPPQLVKDQALLAVRSLGLDFGAVDVIERDGKVWVLEVNTSPGLINSTLSAYIRAMRSFILRLS